MQETITTDVLVVGGGGAGCRAAIEAHDQGADVVMLVKGRLGNSGCTLNVGTSATVAPWGEPDDTNDASLRDLVTYGGFLANQDLAQTLIAETTARVLEMERWGIEFERDADGRITLSRSGAHSHSRNFTFRINAPQPHDYGSPPGIAMMDVLVQQVQARGIRVLEDFALVDLLHAEGRVVGATALDCPQGQIVVIAAGAVILATGTYSQIFSPTTVSRGETGDGQAAAFRVGADLIDMESTQFVATSVSYPTGTVFLNGQGEAFLPRYGIGKSPAGIPKEPLVYAVANEIRAGRGGPRDTIFLDMRTAMDSGGRTSWHLATLAAELRALGLDPRQDLIGSHPRAHTTIGGVRINTRCETTVPGLYAAGAVAGGVYGMARPEGYTSMITLVYGRRAGLYAAQAAKTERRPAPDAAASEASIRRATRLVSQDGDAPTPEEIVAQIKAATYRHAWVIKDADGLQKGLEAIRRIGASWVALKATDGYQWARALEVPNLLLCAELLLVGSLERPESRGAFFRADFPQTDHAHWTRNIIYRRVNGELALETVAPEMKYIRPAA